MPTQNYSNQTFNTWDKTTKDSCVLILGTEEPNSTVDNCIIDGNGAEWALKMPNNRGSTISNSTLIGGKERALDIVKGGDTIFKTCKFSNGNDRKMTSSKWSMSKTCDIGIKGGFDGGLFDTCVFSDMLLGDHDIYDNPQPALPFLKGGVGAKVKNITLKDCVHPNGKNTPIILRIINADLPELDNTNAIAMVYYPWAIKTYFWVAGKWIDSRVAP
jgi:hypothetical protein